MNTTIFFQGEMQFRRYSDTSTQGQQVNFSLADRESLAPFIGKEGKRFMAVLVELGDDEMPVQQPPKAAQPEAPKGGPLAKLAGMWCDSAAFASWLSRTYTDTWAVSSVTEPERERCATTLRILCGINSRAELDSDDGAAMRFQELIRLPYMQHIGTAA